jgi:4-amino-4-deoxy-L-arabinose transferase-like glycosyltransferase
MGNKWFCRELIWVIVVAIALRLVYFTGICAFNPSGFWDPDSQGYYQIAGNIVDAGSFSQSVAEPLKPDHSRTPVYPLFLSVFRLLGLSAPVAVFFQVLLSCVTCIITFYLSYELTGIKSAALVAAIIVAADIPSIALANSLLTETLFTLLLVLSVFFIILFIKKNGYASLCSGAILLGLAVLCRPIAILLPLVFVIVLFVGWRMKMNKFLLPVCILCVCCITVVSVWILRNKLVFDSYFLSTIAQVNMLQCRAAGVYSEINKVSVDEATRKLLEKAKATFPGDRNQDPVGFLFWGGRLGVDEILAHPFVYAKIHLLSLGNMFRPLRSSIDMQFGLSVQRTTLVTWGESAASSVLSRLIRSTSPLTIALVVLQILVIVLSLSGAAYGLTQLALERNIIAFSAIFLVLVYFFILSGGPEAYARFRVPIVPLLAIACGHGVATFINRMRRPRL